MDISALNQQTYLLKHKGTKVTIAAAEVKIEATNEAAVIIQGPGEYEVAGVSVTGMRLNQEQPVVYTIDIDEIRIAYFDGFNGKLEEKELDELDGVDVLIIGPEAKDTARQINPSLIVQTDLVKAKEMELEIRREKKLSLNKLSLPEETELVVLETK